MRVPRIVGRKEIVLSPWVTVLEKEVCFDERKPADVYHSVAQASYVAVFAMRPDGTIPIVRQYRPAVERQTLELPSGLVEKNETPEQSGRRELAEECGFDAPQLELLGTLISDTGRIENRLWCYFASKVSPMQSQFTPEEGLETILAPADQVAGLMARGEFDHALHLAALMLAVVRHGPGLFSLK